MSPESIYPIIDFDDDPTAIIEPSKHIKPMDVPEHCVICFFREVIDRIVNDRSASVIYSMRSENGVHPVYEIEYREKRLAFFYPSVGAPLSAGLMEEAIALGIKHFIACGGCGVLDETLAVGHILVPTAAIRDEGTSYHYIAPSEEMHAQRQALFAIEATLKKANLPYTLTKTWTTDGFYRETRKKAAKYRAKGCLTVEMEAAAFMAVAKFRGVDFGQILYGGDVVKVDSWDHRGWNDRGEIRENLFWLAADACLML